jgi:nucleoside-triphosphatase THEP1
MTTVGSKKRCFIISPIGEPESAIRKHADDVFEYLIKPALDECNIDPIRSDHLDKPGRISDQMFRAIFEYELCIAILTGYNPNVFYELAIAQSANRPVVILIEKGNTLPFDIKDLRSITYDLDIRSFQRRIHIARLINFVKDIEQKNWQGDDLFSSYGLSNLSQSTSQSLDAAFQRESDERPLMRSATRELWLVQETGNLIAEKAKGEILEFLGKGGSVYATFTAPTTNVARLMALRNANLSADAILKRSSLAREHLANLLSNVGPSAERFSVRYIPYPVSFTLVVADPSDATPENRKAIARSAGFKLPFADKIDLTVSGARSPKTLAHFISEAKRHFLFASKVIFLTGPPRSGKTTLFKQVVELYRKSQGLYYVLSLAQWSKTERLGFEYITTEINAPVPFASRNAAGTYDVLSGSLEPVLASVREAHQEGKVLLLDEVGPLQLQEPGFCDLIQEIVEDPRSSLIASLAEPSQGGDGARGFIEDLVHHPRSSVLQLRQGDNEEEILGRLKEELSSALTLYSQMPRALWG